MNVPNYVLVGVLHLHHTRNRWQLVHNSVLLLSYVDNLLKESFMFLLNSLWLFRSQMWLNRKIILLLPSYFLILIDRRRHFDLRGIYLWMAPDRNIVKCRIRLFPSHLLNLSSNDWILFPALYSLLILYLKPIRHTNKLEFLILFRFW